MKLDVSKVREGVAIHCTSKEQAEKLFEAMGWDKSKWGSPPCFWNSFDREKYYAMKDGAWRLLSSEFSSDYSECIEFTDIIIKNSTAAELLGVEDEQEFSFDDPNRKFKVSNCVLLEYRENKWEESRLDFNEIIRTKHLIRSAYTPKYTEEEKEIAKVLHRLMFSDVKKDGSFTYISDMVGSSYHFCHTCDDVFPSIKPGETVQLADIANDN